MKYGPFDPEFKDSPKTERVRLILRSEIELVDAQNQELINRRYLEYEQLHPHFPTNEVPLENWLASSLKSDERKRLNELIKEIYLKREFSKYNFSYMLLAVGSTTFPERAWSGLKRFLEVHDKSKLKYWKNHGEDIDLLFVPEDMHISGDKESSAERQYNQIKRIADILTATRINFKIRTGREDGKTYLTVPEKERKKHKEQAVLRLNKLRYDGNYLTITLPNSRPFHLGFDFSNQYGDLRLKNERVNGYPFSLLFRHNTYYSLLDLIKKTDSQGELFSWEQQLGIRKNKG